MRHENASLTRIVRTPASKGRTPASKYATLRPQGTRGTLLPVPSSARAGGDSVEVFRRIYYLSGGGGVGGSSGGAGAGSPSAFDSPDGMDKGA
jgi:hypothetical protein